MSYTIAICAPADLPACSRAVSAGLPGLLQCWPSLPADQERDEATDAEADALLLATVTRPQEATQLYTVDRWRTNSKATRLFGVCVGFRVSSGPARDVLSAYCSSNGGQTFAAAYSPGGFTCPATGKRHGRALLMAIAVTQQYSMCSFLRPCALLQDNQRTICRSQATAAQPDSTARLVYAVAAAADHDRVGHPGTQGGVPVCSRSARIGC